MLSVNFSHALRIPQSLVTPLKQELQNKVIALAVVIFTFMAGFYLARCYFKEITASSKSNRDQPKLASPAPTMKQESEKVKEQDQSKEKQLDPKQDVEINDDQKVEIHQDVKTSPAKILLDDHQAFMHLPSIEIPQMDEANPKGYDEHVADFKKGPGARFQFSDKFRAQTPEMQFQQVQNNIRNNVEKFEKAFHEAKKIYLNLVVRLLAMDPSLAMNDIHRFDGMIYSVSGSHMVTDYHSLLQIKNDHPQHDFTNEIQEVEKEIAKYQKLAGSWGEAQHWLYEVCDRAEVWKKFHAR